ncbi:hypothetical protein KY366_04330, partial [Candidatus Woesearchaeota archaeon]|nr:hypothetical protein [Candidatus Woesearchaeota archaeon]
MKNKIRNRIGKILPILIALAIIQLAIAAASNNTKISGKDMAINETELNITNPINGTGQRNYTGISRHVNETIPSGKAIDENWPVNESQQINKTATNNSIIIDLEYNSGTPYDEDDDGIETPEGIVDFSVAGTGFGWDVNQEKLCTRWKTYSTETGEMTTVCYGAEKCCGFLNLSSTVNNWSRVFYSYYGRYGAAHNNTISAQVIYVDYNLSPENPLAEIYHSEWADSSARYYRPISNIFTRFKDFLLSAVSVISGESIRINATLTDSNENPIQFHPVNLYLNDTLSDTGLTDILGFVEFDINTTPIIPGEYLIKINYPGQKTIIYQETIQYMSSINFTVVRILPSNSTDINVLEAIQGDAEIGKPVEWTQRIEVTNNATENREISINVSLPSEAENVLIKDKKEKRTSMPEREIKLKNNKTIEFKEELSAKEGKEYEVKYETPAPEKIEYNETSEGGKITRNITIRSDASVHYHDVLSYADIPEVKEGQVRFYWIIDGTKVNVVADPRFNVTLYDTNNNGLVDKISWTVPQLSEQYFILEIIPITKAMHLDQDREFIADIYDSVRAKDDVWYTVNNSEYVRVTFEQELDNRKDITIYARGNGSIIVYEYEGNETVAVFDSVTEEEEYKVYLTNLEGTQDTFDLRINGGVEFDYIVDPSSTELRLYVNSTGQGGKTSDLTITGGGNVTGPPDGLNASAGDHWSNENWYFYMENATATGTISSVNVTFVNIRISGTPDDDDFYLECNSSDADPTSEEEFDWPILWSGSGGSLPASAVNWTYDASAVCGIDTWDEVNKAVFKITSASNGGEESITWYLDAIEMLVIYSDTIAPVISYSSPTPANQSRIGEDWIYVNVSAVDALSNVSTFIDFDDSLVSWWRMDDINGSGDPTDYIGKNNGTAIGNAAQTTSGFLGDGFDFDGDDDRVIAPDDASISGLSAITVSFWVNFNDLGTGDDINFIVAKSNWASQREWRFRTHGSTDPSNSVIWHISNDGNSPATANTVYVLKSSLSTNTWYHFTGTYDDNDGDALKFYIDGILKDSGTGEPGGIFDGSANFSIGSSGNNGAGNARDDFNGTIDDVIIFNRSLTAEEIAALYANTSTKYLGINFTSLSDGSHTFTAYAQDTEGNVGSETRTVTIDLNYPSINFTSPTPANDTLYTQRWFEVNVSIGNASDLDEVKYNWNGTDYTFHDDSLVLMMNFDNITAIGDNYSIPTNKTADASRYGNNGTFKGDATYNASGRYGGAFEFDGDRDFIRIPHDSSLNVSQGFTLAAWIRTRSSKTQVILGFNGAQSDRNYELVLDSDTPKIRICDAATSHIIPADSTVTLDHWDFVSAAYNGTNLSISIDGVTKTVGTSINLLYKAKTLYVGTLDNGDFNNFNGSIDEVRIWNRSMTADELYELYVSNLNKYDADKWLLYVNQSLNASDGLPDGTYTYQAFATDTANNVNQTEERTITIDATPPAMSFESPTPSNGTIQGETYFEVNLSITEANLDEVKYNWNGTNYTMFNDSLVLMMNFDNVSALGENDSLAVDVSGNGNDGIIYEANWTSSGRYGGAFEFDGIDDYIDAGDIDGLDNIQHFTFSLWAKFSGFGAWDEIIMKEADLNNRIGMTLGGSGGAPGDIFVYVGDDSNTYRYVNNVLSLDTWYHLVMVFDGTAATDATRLKFYLNGTELSTIDGGTIPQWTDDNSASVLISDAANDMNGTIDEVRIWDRSLTADEVYQEYASNLNKYDTDKWLLYVNQSKNASDGLDDGAYTYYAYANDNAGNENTTETREITVDTLFSQISFTSPTPANGTSQSQTWFEVNVSIENATDLDEIKYGWNGTNYTIFNDSLVLMMNFDNVSSLGENDSHVFDVTGNGNNGTVINATLNTIDCKFGNCFSFNGAGDHINLGTGVHLQNFTISAWARPDEMDGLKVVISKNRIYELDVNNLNNEKLLCTVGDGSNWQTQPYSYSASTYAIGEWNHFVCRFNGSDLTAYLNGVPGTTTQPDRVPPSSSSQNVRIAQWSTGGWNFNGSIDEVRIWNRSLSVDEIYQEYISNLNKYDTDKWLLYVNQSLNASDGLPDGTYTYQTFVSDINGMQDQTEERTIHIDSTEPGITLNYPGSGSTITSSFINFNWTATDNTASVLSCNLTLDGAVNVSGISSTSGTPTNYTVSGVSDATHTWNISCWDNVSNVNTSLTYSFSVDASVPSINFTSPTPPNGSRRAEDWIYVNVSASDNSNISTVIDFDDSLVSWWRMDDLNASGDVVDYMGRNNGSAVGDAAQTDDGYMGKAFDFDGAGDYINLGNPDSLNSFNSSMSVAAWINLRGQAGDNGWPSIVYKEYYDEAHLDDSYLFNIAWSTKKPQFGVYTNNPASPYYVSSSTAISLNVWYHVVATYNGSRIAIYINGTYEGSSSASGDISPSTLDVGIGTHSTSSNYFNGTIDDVMVFNRSLTQAEVLALYANTLSKYLEVNFTNLSEGSHTVKAYVQDLAGNVNSTELREIGVDSTAPNITPIITINETGISDGQV